MEQRRSRDYGVPAKSQILWGKEERTQRPSREAGALGECLAGRQSVFSDDEHAKRDSNPRPTA